MARLLNAPGETVGIRPKQPVTVADVEGPWVDQDLESGLIERCRRSWNVPVVELSNELLATYLRQKLALSLIVPEAQQRLANSLVDGTELHETELEDALKSATGEA